MVRDVYEVDSRALCEAIAEKCAAELSIELFHKGSFCWPSHELHLRRRRLSEACTVIEKLTGKADK